ncbi:MAG: RagB/SusD family nutrient uptake outer membrane protein [Gemmatimonadetes bacterium]|nr:RagB/SusD family nutrient uptake outer membrane protein [Gemmatimonadota bacterium]
MLRTTSKRYRIGVLAAFLGLAGCGDLLDVEAPGRIADENLNNPNALDALVEGMSADLTDAYDQMVYISPIAAGELFHSGSYSITDEAQGILKAEDSNGEFNLMQQARWVAEHGVERLRANLSAERFQRSPLVARAYIYGAIANRLSGEMLCSTTIDGGPEVPHTVHFERADSLATLAITHGTAAGMEDVVTAAHGVRASARAWLGDWAAAVDDAQQVPTDFVWVVPFGTGTAPGLDLYFETFDRFEFSVINTMFEPNDGEDPRTPWAPVILANGDTATGANGATLVFQQLKYTSEGDDVAATKGTEMLLLRAEAQLEMNGAAGIPEAYTLMNQARAFYGMDPLPMAATLEEAWDDLHYERSATVWLEARHLWDARRWFEKGPSDPGFFDFMEGRDTCFPIGEEERRSNPNLG